jgi:hypothetical protein
VKRYFFSGSLLPFAFLVGCTMPAAHPGATASASSASRSSAAESGAGYRTVWVAPPVGSLLGGGFVPVGGNVPGDSEAALLGTSNQVAAVSRSTGGARELQLQQDRLQLRFGELCAINTVARGNSDKAHAIAATKSKAQSWTELTTAESVNTTAVDEPAPNTNQTTVSSSSSTTERTKGGPDKIKKLGVRPQVLPSN